MRTRQQWMGILVVSAVLLLASTGLGHARGGGPGFGGHGFGGHMFGGHGFGEQGFRGEGLGERGFRGEGFGEQGFRDFHEGFHGGFDDGFREFGGFHRFGDPRIGVEPFGGVQR
jgi:hypothetical protein